MNSLVAGKAWDGGGGGPAEGGGGAPDGGCLGALEAGCMKGCFDDVAGGSIG